MTISGIDEDWSKANPASLYADGYRFAIGYVSQDNTGKNITAGQIAALHGAGIAVGLVYEYNTQSALGGFNQGVADARIAVVQAKALGAPAGTAIYFAVDFDARSNQMGVITAYMAGAISVASFSGYRVGVYGSYLVCSTLAHNSYYLWQTYAWSAGLWEPTAQVRQVQNGIHEAGAVVDRDTVESLTNAGFWLAGNGAQEMPLTSDDVNAVVNGIMGFRVPGTSTPDHPGDRAVIDILHDTAVNRALGIGQVALTDYPDGPLKTLYTVAQGGIPMNVTAQEIAAALVAQLKP